MITFSNPRLIAEFDDWPIGGTARGKCRFEVLHEKKGWRVRKATTDKDGNWCKPKLTTFGGPAAIVNGSDGRTYVIQDCREYGFVNVWGGDLKNPRDCQPIFKRENPESHAELLALIDQGGAVNQVIGGMP